MVSNVSFQGGINTTTNARPYMNAQYQYATAPHQAQADSVEIAGKKKSNKAGKTALAVIGTVVVAAAALFGLVKTGKLNKIDNASKWTEKLQNVAYNAGAGVQKGVEWVAAKGKSLVDKVKGMFGKKEVA